VFDADVTTTTTGTTTAAAAELEQQQQATMSTYKLKITTAITKHGARGGSSLVAIKKALKVEPKQFRFINAALNKGVKDGTFTQVGGKYKVTKTVKKKKVAKKKVAKKKVVKKKVAKKKVDKKKPAKKSTKKKKVKNACKCGKPGTRNCEGPDCAANVCDNEDCGRNHDFNYGRGDTFWCDACHKKNDSAPSCDYCGQTEMDDPDYISLVKCSKRGCKKYVPSSSGDGCCEAGYNEHYFCGVCENRYCMKHAVKCCDESDDY